MFQILVIDGTIAIMKNNTLTRKQFDILTFLDRCSGKVNQREISDGVKMSLATVNRTISALTELGYLSGYCLTGAGYTALEPYRVKRAVFLAAGFGHRLVPITLNTPRSLIRIRGERIIDSILDAVLAAGIEEIYIVRGYLGEQFDQLLHKYPSIHFIENPIYNESFNISSAMCARHLLENAYVLEADLLLRNPRLIQKYQYCSNYLGVPVDMTDDWCLTTKNDVVTSVDIGGTNCYHMFGISYWDGTDGARLYEDIKQVFEAPGGKERYWDLIPLQYCKDHYRVAVRQCSFDDIAEIDTIADLKKLDPAYL